MMPAIEYPLNLHTVVLYHGEVALIVARAKPVGLPWRYDLLIERNKRLEIITEVLADDFQLQPREAA